jgi:hypothetical protein
MNPAGKVRCNMRNQYGWLTTIATFTGSKSAFCYPRLGHDVLRLRRGKPRPAGKNKPSAGRGAYAICASPEEKPRLLGPGLSRRYAKEILRKRVKCLTCDHRRFARIDRLAWLSVCLWPRPKLFKVGSEI